MSCDQADQRERRIRLQGLEEDPVGHLVDQHRVVPGIRTAPVGRVVAHVDIEELVTVVAGDEIDVELAALGFRSPAVLGIVHAGVVLVPALPHANDPHDVDRRIGAARRAKQLAVLILVKREIIFRLGDEVVGIIEDADIAHVQLQTQFAAPVGFGEDAERNIGQALRPVRTD